VQWRGVFLKVPLDFVFGAGAPLILIEKSLREGAECILGPLYILPFFGSGVPAQAHLGV
jgi:hypothetical protein